MQAVQGARMLSWRPAHGHTGAIQTMGLAQQRLPPFSWSLRTQLPIWSGTRLRWATMPAMLSTSLPK